MNKRIKTIKDEEEDNNITSKEFGTDKEDYEQ